MSNLLIFSVLLFYIERLSKNLNFIKLTTCINIRSQVRQTARFENGHNRGPDKCSVYFFGKPWNVSMSIANIFSCFTWVVSFSSMSNELEIIQKSKREVCTPRFIIIFEDIGGCRQDDVKNYFPRSLAQESRRVTMRLKTGLAGVLSSESRQK